MTPGRLIAAALAAAVAAGAAGRALAAVPSAERVLRAAASANATARRDQPLRLEVAVLDPQGRVIATGQARLEPLGTSRLELAFSAGSVEIHERSAAHYRVTRGGRSVERALPLLPPVQLLQAGAAGELEAALRLLGGDPERVDLGIEGGSDCWVVGGRDAGPFDANRRPSLWVDQATRRPVRIDEEGGVHFHLGPQAENGAARFPAWIEVEAPGWPRARLEIGRIEAAGAPAGPR
jgi:hypothetical protein